MAEYETKFSGVKQEYASGATRDSAQGKGKYAYISPVALKRLAGVYERGAANHGAHNWTKGFPLHRGLDSALRHIFQHLEGMRDEDHLAQAAWNLFAVMHFEEMIERGLLPKELDDLPNYMPSRDEDYLLEPEDVEISAGKDLTLEELEKKLEAALLMPLDAGHKALEETERLIAKYELVTVTGPMGPTGVVGHTGPTPTETARNTIWTDFVSRHHLTVEEEEDFGRWYYSQGCPDSPDYGRLLDEFFLWKEHNMRPSYDTVPSFRLMDGYGYDDRKTLFGSVVGTPSPTRNDYGEAGIYKGWGTRND